MSMENTSIPSEIRKLKSQLKDITDEELKSLAVRARVDSALYDEKCSSFFFNKIRKRRNKNGVSSIQEEFNNLKTAPKDILKYFINSMRIFIQIFLAILLLKGKY